jgi:hypothetical protein
LNTPYDIRCKNVASRKPNPRQPINKTKKSVIKPVGKAENIPLSSEWKSRNFQSSKLAKSIKYPLLMLQSVKETVCKKNT